LRERGKRRGRQCEDGGERLEEVVEGEPRAPAEVVEDDGEEERDGEEDLED
jgi:hypothetical protein